MTPQEQVSLAPLTTLELGGPARFFVRASSEAELEAAVDWARAKGVPVTFFAGGSNLVVSDEGFDGLVVQIALGGVEISDSGEVIAFAGESWDSLVARTVAENLAGFECLSGIPGSVGATPIQNVGAYGQEVADTITSVRVFDRASGEVRELSPARCEFGYRDSYFKQHPNEFIVLAVHFLLRPGEPATVKYAELERALGGTSATPAKARETVIALRRKKSMVIEAADPNRRSAGSFFTNPIVTTEDADRVVDLALERGLVDSPSDVPRYPAGANTKLAAGWLIERSGFNKGHREGPVGISTKHALALVHHGNGSTRDLVELARKVRGGVEDSFGITLSVEPTQLGVEI